MMKARKILASALAALMLLGLAGCGEKATPVFVQSVGKLTSMGSISLEDKFPGVVVSEEVTEIQKDGGKTVADVFVKEGDDVTAGQELFAYDSEELELTLNKQKLELEQMKSQVESLSDQIKTLEKEKKSAPKDEKLQYTVQIQSLEADRKETEYNIKAKEAEIAQSEKILENVSVVSPVDGRIQAISENGTDNYGNPLPYITIQKTGSYRVKGTIGELQRGSLMEGTRLRILSRTDENQVWTGTVTLVDYENPEQENNNGMIWGGGKDPMTSASKYPFYVELDSVEGLILGQHVYLEADNGGASASGLQLPGYMVVSEESGKNYVWAENGKGKLEKREITLGTYNEMMGTYEVLGGLMAEDYIAVPDENLCKAGAPTTHEYVAPDPEENPGGAVDGGVLPDGGVVNGGIMPGGDGPVTGGSGSISVGPRGHRGG